jgi:hypothetical protein
MAVSFVPGHPMWPFMTDDDGGADQVNTALAADTAQPRDRTPNLER